MNVFVDIIWPIIDLIVAGGGIAIIIIAVLGEIVGDEAANEWFKQKHIPLTCGKLFVIGTIWIAVAVFGSSIFFQHFPELYEKSVFRIFNFIRRFI